MAAEEEDGTAGATGAVGTGDSHRLFRWRMPADDEVLEAFFAAQPRRGVGAALRQLCHMWVNTYGAVPVLDTVLTGAGFGDPGDPGGAAGLPVQSPSVPPAATGPLSPAPSAAETGPVPEQDRTPVGESSSTSSTSSTLPTPSAPSVPQPAERTSRTDQSAQSAQSADDIFRGM